MEQDEEDSTAEVISAPAVQTRQHEPEETPNLTADSFQDKASFREQASSFLKVLEESSRFRSKLPEPKGNKPGQLGDGLSPRPFPAKMEQADGDTTLVANKNNSNNPPTQQKPRSGPGLKQLDTKTTTLVAITYVSGKEKQAPQSPRTPVKNFVSLPPLAEPDPATKASRLRGVTTYSRHGKDISTHLKLNNIGDSNQLTPNSPRISRGPNSPFTSRKAKDINSGNISLDEATDSLCAPLTTGRGTPRN